MELGTRYRVEKLLGQGGMGQVYKAYDKELGRIVALKVLRPEFAADPTAKERFKQELLLASKVSQKNILRIHDLGEADGLKFISMAFIEGEDLHQVLERCGRLPVERAVSIVGQLCEALRAAHAEGVVHRDLKPQNILIGAGDHVYVSDFGLAKSLEASVTGMTHPGTVLGTPRYMAPEQVEGGKVDHRTDLYAVGLILHEMVTGEAPFSADSAMGEMFRRVKETPKDARVANPEVPEYLAKVILRCLEKEPDHRYQSAEEILSDLRLEKASSAARSLRVPLPSYGRRSWFIMSGLAAAVALALGLLFLGIPGLRERLTHLVGDTAASRGAASSGKEKFVAILPFRVVGEDTSLGYLADGLVDGLSAKLFAMKEVRLASTAATEKIDPRQPQEKIARELGITLLIRGTIQAGGGKIDVVVNLDDVAGRRRILSQEFSGVRQDLLTMEDQIYNKLLDALALKPGAGELAHGALHPTENVEAYDLYLRGRNAIHGGWNPKNVQTALEDYEQALQKDPTFALAYTGLADAYLAMYYNQKNGAWTQRALAAGLQARRLDENLPEAHFSLGEIYRVTGKTAESLAELKRALERAPNSDEGYRRLGQAYLHSGRKDEALQAHLKAIELNPYYWLNYYALGQAYSHLGDNEKALSAFHKVVELDPENAAGYDNLGITYFAEGKLNDSIPFFKKALELRPFPDTYSNLGVVHFYLKQYGESAKMFEKAVQLKPTDQLFVGNLGDAYRWSGQSEKANDAYDKAIELALNALKVNPRDAATMGYLALYYAKRGRPGEAIQMIHHARAIDANSVDLMSQEAVVQTLAGRRVDALRTLREALQKGYAPADARNEPEFNKLREQPDFDKLLAEFSKKVS